MEELPAMRISSEIHPTTEKSAPSSEKFPDKSSAWDVVRQHYEHLLPLFPNQHESIPVSLDDISSEVSRQLRTWASTLPILPINQSSEFVEVFAYLHRERSERHKLCEMFSEIVNDDVPDCFFSFTLSLIANISSEKVLLSHICEAISELFVRTVRGILINDTKALLTPDFPNSTVVHRITVSEVMESPWETGLEHGIINLNDTKFQDYISLFTCLRKFLSERLCDLAFSICQKYSQTFPLDRAMLGTLRENMRDRTHLSFRRHYALFLNKGMKLQEFAPILKRREDRTTKGTFCVMANNETKGIPLASAVKHLGVRHKFDILPRRRKFLRTNRIRVIKFFNDSIDVFKNVNLNLSDKMKAHDNFLNLLLHGCETWSIQTIWYCLEPLRSTHQQLLLVMLDSERKSYEWLLEKSHVENILIKILRRKWALARDVVEQPEYQIEQTYRCWQPQYRTYGQWYRHQTDTETFSGFLREQLGSDWGTFVSDELNEDTFMKNTITSLLGFALSDSLSIMRAKEVEIRKFLEQVTTPTSDANRYKITQLLKWWTRIEDCLQAMEDKQRSTENSQDLSCLLRDIKTFQVYRAQITVLNTQRMRSKKHRPHCVKYCTSSQTMPTSRHWGRILYTP